MPEKQNLYFIAIVPPAIIGEEITSFKHDFSHRFNSSSALKVQPHITLKAPFKKPFSYHNDIVEWFQQMVVSVKPFKQELKHFGAFPNKRSPVIYVKPLPNPGLITLQKQVLLDFRKKFPLENIMDLEFNYSPHMTVAYRDLQPHLFKAAWSEYQTRKYEATFEVASFHLLQHDTVKWNVVDTYYLK